MATKIDPHRLEVAQAVLAAVHPNARMWWDRGFWFGWSSRGVNVQKRWVASSEGSDFPKWSDKAPWGGTTCRVLTQLMAWCRHQPVIPLRCWRYWCSPTVNLNPKALGIVAAAGWPEVVPCIGCGRGIRPHERFDEYSRGKVHGPGCLPMCESLKKSGRS